LADYLAIAITNARNHKKIVSLAITDDVTGFYNTRFLHDHLDKLLEQGKMVSLVFMDLDNFKQVVDTHGHPLGSKMLREVALVIASQLEDNDRLVRYGGDEYVVILPDQNKPAALDKMGAVRRQLADAIFLEAEGLKIKTTASFGIASYPQDAADKRGLLQMADQSMYRSKKLGKNSITVV